jgi:hypothetical protein
MFVETQTDSIVYPRVGDIYSGDRITEIDILQLNRIHWEVTSNVK